MGLQSKHFRGDPKLETCLVNDSAHIKQGAVGEHVGKIQVALAVLDDADLLVNEISTSTYGPDTANAVLAYKIKRNIVNRSYQSKADDIVGKMTIASLDREMLQREIRPPIPRLPPEATAPPILPPKPLPNNAYVTPTLKSWPGYAFLKDYQAAEHWLVGAASTRILNEYFLKYYPALPIGTILPVMVNWKDYLFIFDWHGPDKRNPAWHKSVSALRPTEMAVNDLVGRWSVQYVTGWSWFYKFERGAMVFSTDIHEPPEQAWVGIYRFIGKSLRIVWQGAGTEEWFLPIVPNGQRGQSLVHQGSLSAEKLKRGKK
jgi:hypothetical protein